jgi:hypothetical protein
VAGMRFSLGGGNDYSSVRKLIAVLLTLLLIVMEFLDALVPDYHVDQVVTGSILGTIIAIVGVDVSKRFGGGSNGNGGAK